MTSFYLMNISVIAAITFSLSDAARKKKKLARKNRHGHGHRLKNEATGSTFHARLMLMEWNCSIPLIRLIILNL